MSYDILTILAGRSLDEGIEQFAKTPMSLAEITYIQSRRVLRGKARVYRSGAAQTRLESNS